MKIDNRSLSASDCSINTKLGQDRPILDVRGLTKRFGGLEAVANVDFAMLSGEIMALIGPNGAGKTTVVNLLTGFQPPDEGIVIFNGRNIRKLSVHERCALGMTRTFQIAQPFRGLTVIENVMVAAMSVEPSLKKSREEGLKLLEFAGLQDKKYKLAGQLTLVEQKELELLRCLATKPKLLFVDELMTGLTPKECHEAIATLRDIRDTGISILFIEHKLDVVVRLAEKVIVLDFGKKIAEGVCEEVMNNGDVIKAYEEKAMSGFLELIDVGASYGETRAIYEISCSIEKSETVAFLGSNGAGKSTLLKAIGGILRPIKGSIKFNGKEIANLTAHDIVREGIVLVPETRALFPDMTVEENLEMGGFTLKDSRQLAQTKNAMMDIFPVLRDRVYQLAGTLSGGEQQQLAIARGLMSIPKILMLDEPSLGLAPKIVEEVYGAIENIFSQQDMTVLILEQNIAVALKVSDRGYILENGTITLDGSASSLSKNDYVKRAYLGM